MTLPDTSNVYDADAVLPTPVAPVSVLVLLQVVVPEDVMDVATVTALRLDVPVVCVMLPPPPTVTLPSVPTEVR